LYGHVIAAVSFGTRGSSCRAHIAARRLLQPGHPDATNCKADRGTNIEPHCDPEPDDKANPNADRDNSPNADSDADGRALRRE